jgi:hypothetical protein
MSSPVPAVASPEHRRSQSHTHHDDAHTTDHNTDHDDLDTDNDNDNDLDHDTDMAADHNQDKPPANGQKPQANAKDPLRPRRKKARRACFACQRAHLTCGIFPTPHRQHCTDNADTPR